MSTTETYVTLSDGAELKVWVLGDDESKPLFIAHHGAPGLSSHLEPLAGYSFLQEKFRVLVYDCRGSGASDLKGPFTDEQWVSDVEELRAWAGAETFILAGGSYGGALAMKYALAYPNRLSGLILRDTWTNGPRAVLGAVEKILTSRRISVDSARQILPIYLPPKEEGDPEAGFEGASDEYELRWQVHNAAFSYSVPRLDLRFRLGDIKVPTLVVVGRHDPVCPVAESEEIAAGIKNSKLVIFENSGHNPPSDEPEAFQKTVYEYLAGLGM